MNKEKAIIIKVDSETKLLFEETAKQAGKNVSSFIRDLVNTYISQQTSAILAKFNKRFYKLAAVENTKQGPDIFNYLAETLTIATLSALIDEEHLPDDIFKILITATASDLLTTANKIDKG